jgi:hypothetical protein
VPTDRQLTAPGSRSRARVEAMSFRGTRAIVVTRETLTADGRSTTRWRVTLAGMRREGGRWVLRRWDPQP